MQWAHPPNVLSSVAWLHWEGWSCELEDWKGSFPVGKMVLGFITHPWDF